MKKVSFVEGIIEGKAEFENEEDRLLVKRAEMALLRKYNWFRAPFMAGAATVSFLALSNPRLSPFKRLFPLCFSAPLIVFYQSNIGMYGVQR